ncbi:hypothetical protein M2132_000186 [Dysgonomonas sp. PH5-45]|nr:hypothetical protein [Dysgonomonas sp. PH5-45]MDH6386772.1 hypothetical protein [Dysgonomonas sp. PH5-37]
MPKFKIPQVFTLILIYQQTNELRGEKRKDRESFNTSLPVFASGTPYVFLSTIKYNSLCCSSIVSGYCLVFPEEGNITFI